MISVTHNRFFVVVVILSALGMLPSEPACSGDAVITEIVVTAPAAIRSLDAPAADIIVLDRADIEVLQAERITDVLESVAGAYLLERGTPGAQADIHLRGSSGEGALVLVNGVPVTDPQTGHFSLDIPVSLDAVKRIEIMGGGGSSRFGSAAAGGIINIVTGEPAPGAEGSMRAGSHGSGAASATWSRSEGSKRAVVTFSGNRSDGYRPGTDLRDYLVSASGGLTESRWTLDWHLGWREKRFGAAGFYAPYPSYEETATILGAISGMMVIDGDRMLRFRAGARGHDDVFTLDRENPDFYRNTHYSRRTHFAAEYISGIFGSGRLTVGGEAARTGITSGSLGNRGDTAGALYGSCDVPVRRNLIGFSVRADRTTGGDVVVSPGAGIAVPLAGNVRFRLRAERSFREPTYTERYYRDPANRGDADLDPERSETVESGFDLDRGLSGGALTVYRRRGTRVIDWIRGYGDTVWRAANHGAVVTTGIETRARISLGGSALLSVHGALNDQSVRRRAGIESKYALRLPDRTAVIALSTPVSGWTAVALTARYDHMTEGDERMPVRVSCERGFGPVIVRATVDNLFNERYEALPGLPARGRWMSVEVRSGGS